MAKTKKKNHKKKRPQNHKIYHSPKKKTVQVKNKNIINDNIIYVTKKRLRLKAWVFWVLIIISLTVVSYSIYQIINWLNDNQKINNLEKEIETLVEYEFIDDEGTLINPPVSENDEKKDDYVSDYWYYVKFPFYQVDFTNLINKNSDTKAYINVPNTNVNYPVVQTTDNEYYLTRAFDKSENNAGWVYIDYRNTFDPMSDNIIIYGHGRQNNTMFGSLKKTLTDNWQSNKDNFIINLSTPTTNYVYQIFSIYTIESESYYIQTDFYTTKEKQKWLDTMAGRNTAKNITATVNTNDKILTLSTCYNDDGIRLVVQAKLLKSSN